jgi:hypothetical protein
VFSLGATTMLTGTLLKRPHNIFINTANQQIGHVLLRDNMIAMISTTDHQVNLALIAVNRTIGDMESLLQTASQDQT